MIKIPALFLFLFMAYGICGQEKMAVNTDRRLRHQIGVQIEKSMRTELLTVWYPKAVDSLYGGFLSTFTFDPSMFAQFMATSEMR